MTLGERIAYLRREKNLSQEGLGDLVGVSRQAVSKWEADRALPDVNNCVAMSRVFGISLAELLELEESVSGSERNGISLEKTDPDANDLLDSDLESRDLTDREEKTKELTTEQIFVVEKMIDKYAAAQKKIRRKLRWPLILLGCLLIVGGAWLWQWLTDMNQTIDYLHGQVAGLQSEIISGISEQVQASLREESSLVTDYSTQIVAVDLWQNTITYELAVNLKEGNVNTRQQVMARCDKETWTADMVSTGGLGFSGQITCPLQDDTALYLLIEEDSGRTRSQRLEVWNPEEWYYVIVDGWVGWTSLQEKGLTEGATEELEIYLSCYGGPGLDLPLQVTRAEIAVLRNQEVISTQPIDLQKVSGDETSGEWYLHATEKIAVTSDMATEGEYLIFELRVWDNYDRYYPRVLSQYQIRQGGSITKTVYELQGDSQ